MRRLALMCVSLPLAAVTTIDSVAAQFAPCLERNYGPGLGAGDDWVSAALPLGFNFPWDGGVVTDIQISSNGFIWFGAGANAGSRCCNGVEAGFLNDPPSLAPLWVDLTPSGVGGDVHFKTFTNPNRAVVTWRELREYGQPTPYNPFTIQLQLEATGAITFFYGDNVRVLSHTSIVGASQGNGAAANPIDVSGVGLTGGNTFHELFDTAANPVDLAGKVIRFASSTPTPGYFGFPDTACVESRADPYGAGCPAPLAADFYELFVGVGVFDLSGRAVRLRPNATGGYDVTSCANCFIPTFTNNLNSGDDQLFAGMALGFTMHVPGIGGVNAIDIDSNGRCGVALGVSDFTASVPEFLAQKLFAACWDDFNPSASGGVYYDVSPGRAVVTWANVPQYPALGSNTFQAQFYANGDVVYVWPNVTDDALVGFSPGLNQADPGSRDISATLPFSTHGATPLSLASSAATPVPTVGRAFDLEVAAFPGGSVAGALVFGFGQLSIDLSPFGFTGCWLLSTSDVSGSFTIPATGVATLPLGPLPNDPNLLGFVIYLQAAVIAPGVNPASVVTSNGCALTVGAY